MRKKIKGHNLRKILLFILLLLPILTVTSISGADEDTEDIFASVVVLSAFDIQIVNNVNYLDFGIAKPGEAVTLKENTYYNEIKCVSNKGTDYFIKIDIIGDIIGPKGVAEITPSSFQWKIYSVKGKGSPIEGWQDFQKDPVLVYSSASGDNAGEEVSIKFQYKLNLPANAVPGHYSMTIGYIITEEQ